MNAKSESLVVKQPDLLEQIIQSTNDCGITITEKGALGFQNFTGLAMLSKLIFDSGICPSSMDSSKKVLVAIARGLSIGLDPFQSMESFYVVNGIATLYGTAPLSLARQHPQWVEEGFDEWFEVGGKRVPGHPKDWTDDVTAVCQTQRGKAEAKQRRFSVADAKKASLWSHPKKLYGVYPFRMLPARARGYAIQDNFGDSLKGIQIRETFDEEVDGRPVESNGDQLRGEVEKRKGKQHNAGLHPIQPIEQVSNSPDRNAGIIQNAMKQSFPDPLEGKKPGPIDDIEGARSWVRSVFDKIPIRMGASSMLKDASLRDGKYISYEHIENIDDVEYLKSIAANLEDALKAEVTQR